MEDLIKREDAIKAVEECLKPLARPRYTVKTAIEAIPSVDIPHSDDWEKYSDKLWKNAYERGKADRPQDWVPCSERMPVESSFEPLLICDSDGHMTVGAMILGKWAKQAQIGTVVAWMPLPEPWKGEGDE